MSNEEYIQGILQDATVTPDGTIGSALRARGVEVETHVSAAYRESGPEITIVGSYAKGTMIRQSYDLDLTCYFDRDEDEPGGTLEEIYNSVKETLEKRYIVTPKTSAIRIKKKRGSTEEDDFYIDVVPGRFINKRSNDQDVFIYQRDAEKCRLRTNLEKHLSHIRDSGQTDVIRISKLWRELSKFELKTFILELLVIDVTKSTRKRGLSDRFEHFLREIKDNFDAYQVADPANSNNDLSGALDAAEDALKAAATLSLDLFADGGWESVFPKPAAVRARLEAAQFAKRYLVLGTASHAEVPPWPLALRYRVELGAAKKLRRIGIWKPYKNGEIITDGANLRFRAVTNAPSPYEMRWQVVNTGRHATTCNGLRGEIFSSVGLRGSNSEDVNFESTTYSGRHWVQCFVVKDGWLVGQSERFEVPIVNSSSNRPAHFWKRA